MCLTLQEFPVIVQNLLPSINGRFAQITSLFMDELPTEILSIIFISCIPEQDKGLIDPDTAPLLLLRICKRWSAVASSTAWLWRYINVSLDFYKPQPLMMWVTTWLTRSITCPLSISLRCSVNRPEYSGPVIKFLLQHTHRWEELHLDLPIVLYLDLASAEGRLPLLRRLSLEIYDFPFPQILRTFQDTPKLESIQISSGFEGVALPWTQIKHCTTFAFHFHDCLEIIRKTPRLVDFTFNESPSPIGVSRTVFAPNSPVESQMISLHLIDTFPGGRVALILPLLMLPALREMSIKFCVDPLYPTMNHNQFIDLFSRSHCQLERLILHSAIIEYDGLLAILHVLPGLTTLRIGRHVYANEEQGTPVPIIDKRFLEQLTCSSNLPHHQTVLLPCLRDLAMFVSSARVEDYGILMKSRRLSRTKDIALLSSLRLEFDRKLEIEEILWMEQLSHDELELHIVN